MKREFKNFFSKKYIFIVIAILLCIMSFFWYASIPRADNEDFHFQESVYSDFIEEIKPYDSQEELKAQYEKLNVYAPGMTNYNNGAQYISLLYKLSITYQLPYDSLVEFSEETKYTQFHYLGTFKAPIMIFILLASLLIGGFYQTSDVMNKMSKLIFSSGEKRTKIIDRKYGVSLLVMIALVTVIEIIIALLGLMYRDSGAKYCVLYTGGNSLYVLNYFQYFCLFLTSHLIALTVVYTFVYYLSVICKNGILPVCAIFSILLVYVLIQTNLPDRLFFNMLIRGGFIEALYNRDIANAVNLNNLCLYIPIILVPIIVFVISRFTIKRTDYSR